MSRGSPGPITRTRPPVVGRSPGTHGTSTASSIPVSTVAKWGLGAASLYPGVRVARGGWGVGKWIFSRVPVTRWVNAGLSATATGLEMAATYYSLKTYSEGAVKIAGPDYKLGFRYGATGGIIPLSSTMIGQLGYLGGTSRSVRRLPLPTYGFGFKAVPEDEARFGAVKPHDRQTFSEWSGVGQSSRGGLSVQSSQHRGQHKRGPSSPSPSAQSGTRGLSSAERVSGGGTRGSRPRRRGSRSRHTRSTLRSTPRCPVHNVSHWCNVTRKIRFGS